jgi:hypothetical protein
VRLVSARGAYIGALQYRPQRALGRHRVFAHKLLGAGNEAAEVMGPGWIGRCVDEDVANFLLPQFQRKRVGCKERVDFSLREELRIVVEGGVYNPVDIFLRVEPHIPREHGDKKVIVGLMPEDRDGFALHIARR